MGVVAVYITYMYANCTQVKSLVVNVKQKLSQYLEKWGPATKADSLPNVD